MKGSVCLIAFAVAVLEAHGYVLLTANIEDLQAIAQRIVASPMADHLYSILRRASNVFTEHVNKANDENDDGLKYVGPGSRRSETKPPEGAGAATTVTITEDLPLGKNASVFLRSIKKIFENV